MSSNGLEGSAYLAVPYFDTQTGKESSSPVATPGLYRGAANLKVVNNMQGIEINGFTSLYSGCFLKLGVLAGFRYWNFNENLTFVVDSPALTIPGEIYNSRDQFHTRNNFYGGQIGLGFYSNWQRLFFTATGKVALGGMQEYVSIKGKFITNNFDGYGAAQTFLGGYFALPSNIGNHKRTRFAVLPEVDLNLGYKIADYLSISVGYTFLYVNEVLFAGKQMNRNINPTQSSLYEFTATPTPEGKPSPRVSYKSGSIWAQGINVGLEIKF